MVIHIFNVQVIKQGVREKNLWPEFLLAVMFLVPGCKSKGENGTGTGQTDQS